MSFVLREINDLFDGHVRAFPVVMVVLISQAGVHKAWGLEEDFKRWDLDGTDHGFGDKGNDKKMLELLAGNCLCYGKCR